MMSSADAVMVGRSAWMTASRSSIRSVTSLAETPARSTTAWCESPCRNWSTAGWITSPGSATRASCAACGLGTPRPHPPAASPVIWGWGGLRWRGVRRPRVGARTRYRWDGRRWLQLSGTRRHRVLQLHGGCGHRMIPSHRCPSKEAVLEPMAEFPARWAPALALFTLRFAACTCLRPPPRQRPSYTWWGYPNWGG